MTATEPVQGGPYPEPTDPPDGPNQLKAIVDWAASRSVMRFASDVARDAAITSPVAGMKAITGTGATLVEWIHDGSSWVERWSASSGRPYRMETGTASIPVSGTPRNGSGTVTLTPGRFTQAPFIFMTPAQAIWSVAAVGATTTDFTGYVRDATGSSGASSVTVRWLAVQATPTAAAG